METKRTSVQALVDFLGIRRNMVALLTMVIRVGLGEKMAERFLPIYLVALDGGALSIGLVNGMDNLLSALYSYPGDYASDRRGYKRALILFNLIAAARPQQADALTGSRVQLPFSGGPGRGRLEGLQRLAVLA